MGKNNSNKFVEKLDGFAALGEFFGFKVEEDNKQEAGKPTTPYNFIPLNKRIITSPLHDYINLAQDNIMGYKKYITEEETYSGYFEIELTNLTPLYIAGNQGMIKNGQYVCIPGSSIRGCLKNLLKIYTNGSFKADDNPDITDRKLYYRGLASAYHPYRDLYSEQMTTSETIKDKEGHTKNINVSKAKGGFLVKLGKKFYICSADMERIEIKGKASDGKIEWETGKEVVAYIYTGKINGKKHYYKIHSPKLNKRYAITDELLDSYLRDKNRKGISLLNLKDKEKTNLKKGWGKTLGEYSFAIPCFYVLDNNDNVKHFGAGPYYRIPYDSSIADHIPKLLKGRIIDFSEALFGHKEYWASRVFVEDAYSKNNKAVDLYGAEYMKTLMGPNPTSFQFYLTPTEDGKANHWDTNAVLRGYKMYWHRYPDWKYVKNGSKQDDKLDEHTKKITPIKENQSFVGKIRFKNLTAVEVGALAYFFHLSEQENCAYKLGMGKPLGLGSVKVKADLYLEDKNFYSSLFQGNSFAKGQVASEKTSFIDQFEAYVKTELRKQNQLAKYEEKMAILKLMLNPKYVAQENKAWQAKTAYMNINDKSNRPLVNERVILPSVKEVFK